MQHRVWDKPCNSAVEHYWIYVFSHTYTLSLSHLFSSSKEVNYKEHNYFSTPFCTVKSSHWFLETAALKSVHVFEPLSPSDSVHVIISYIAIWSCTHKYRYLSKAHANISFPDHVLMWKLRSWDDRTQRPWRKRESWGERQIHYLMFSLFMRQYRSLRETKTHSPSPCSTSPHSALID